MARKRSGPETGEAGEQGLKIDLHVHTSRSSDSNSVLADMVRAARRKGLAGIAITDHNETRDATVIDGLARGHGIIILRGVEISTSQGHILAYGVSGPFERDQRPHRTIEAIRREGGVCVAAHPYRRISGLSEAQVRRLGFDAFETRNSRSQPWENEEAERLAAEMHMPRTGGSDAHEPDSVGNAYTIFPAGLTTEAELLEAIRSGRTQPGGRSATPGELAKYYLTVGAKWARRGFRRA